MQPTVGIHTDGAMCWIQSCPTLVRPSQAAAVSCSGINRSQAATTAHAACPPQLRHLPGHDWAMPCSRSSRSAVCSAQQGQANKALAKHVHSIPLVCHALNLYVRVDEFLLVAQLLLL